MADSKMGSRSERPGTPRTVEFTGQCTEKRGAQEVTPDYSQNMTSASGAKIIQIGGK